ncbi:MAG: acyl carrier protein [Candidatus Sumerlaeota bacterium]|nr:acyl carrier protein [Candidatus Sumerlaeota bacterium]
MTRSEITDRLTLVFRNIFSDNSLTLFDEMKARDVASWDSMNNVRLVLAIEAEFGIKFSLREINNLQNVGALLSLMEKKIR